MPPTQGHILWYMCDRQRQRVVGGHTKHSMTVINCKVDVYEANNGNEQNRRDIVNTKGRCIAHTVDASAPTGILVI